MSRYSGRKDRDDVALLSIDEFIKLAADRGVTLWVEINRFGRVRLTDGKRKMPVSRLYQGSLMPSDTVAAAVLYFFGDTTLSPDFAMDPKPEDY